MSQSRLESFSDGVLAVAITLLVLNLTVPPLGGRPLPHELGKQWPQYAAYTISFVTIGIIWINHHAMIGRLRRPDHSILFLNLLLLMSVGALPFATNMIATYLGHRGDHLAAAVYGGAFLVMSILFSALNAHILFRRTHLLAQELPLERRRYIISRGVTGLLPYAIATALAPVSAYATFVICAAVAVFYALPVAAGGGD